MFRMKPIDQTALDQLFANARTHNEWLPEPVDEALLHRLYEAMKFGPTGANSCPARIVFVKSPEQKERLVACMSPGNQAKTRNAPVVAIVAYDTEFYEQLPKLFPHAPDARSWFAGNEKKIAHEALMNGSLQGGYFIIAARALGLDCGPMGGFDHDRINAAFFPDGKWKANFVCNLGHGDASKLFPRNPRLSFEEACRIV
jgi:3-hydroxypropanoate dehydrogenase